MHYYLFLLSFFFSPFSQENSDTSNHVLTAVQGYLPEVNSDEIRGNIKFIILTPFLYRGHRDYSYGSVA